MWSCDGLIIMGPRSMSKWRPLMMAEERTDLNVGEGGSGWGMHITPQLIHVNAWQNALKCCEVISLQLIKKMKKIKNKCGGGCSRAGIFKEKGSHRDSVMRNGRDAEEMWVFKREGRRKRRNERRKGSKDTTKTSKLITAHLTERFFWQLWV